MKTCDRIRILQILVYRLKLLIFNFNILVGLIVLLFGGGYRLSAILWTVGTYSYIIYKYMYYDLKLRIK